MWIFTFVRVFLPRGEVTASEISFDSATSLCLRFDLLNAVGDVAVVTGDATTVRDATLLAEGGGANWEPGLMSFGADENAKTVEVEEGQVKRKSDGKTHWEFVI